MNRHLRVADTSARANRLACTAMTLAACMVLTLVLNAALYAAPKPPAVVIVKSTLQDDGWGLPSEGHAVAAKGSRVFVAGTSSGAVTGKNISIGQYKRSLKWDGTMGWDGGSNQDDEIFDVAIGRKGEIYVTGYITQGGAKEIRVEKRLKDLGPNTSTTASGAVSGDDSGRAIILDKKGNVYTVGRMAMYGWGTDIWVAKYDPNMQPLGNTTIDGPSKGSAGANALALDSTGNLFVAGYRPVAGQGQDIWVGRLDASFNVVKEAYVAGFGAGNDAAYDILVEKKDVYVVGTIATEAQGLDIWIGKFDNDLNLIASATYAAPDGHDDFAYAIAKGPGGRYFVAGKVATAASVDDAWVAIYDKYLRQVAQTTYSSAGVHDDAVYGAIAFSSGQVLVAGRTFDPAGNANVWLARFKGTRLPAVKKPVAPGME